MRWKTVKNLKADQFKRLVGVKPDTFEKMVSEAKRISKLEGKKQQEKSEGQRIS